MNASTIKLTALWRSGLAAMLVSAALLTVSAPRLVDNSPARSACQSSSHCGG